MVNTKATADVDVTELMRQFALMFPAFAAAATSAPPAAPTATAPVVAATATAPVVAAPVAAPTALLSSQEAESQIIDISAGGKCQ